MLALKDVAVWVLGHHGELRHGSFLLKFQLFLPFS